MLGIYINFCTVVGFMITTACIGGAALFLAALIVVFILDRSGP